MMLLGEVIARFDDEAAASEALLSLGDLALMLRVNARAAEQHITAGQLAMQAVGDFVSSASDEDWLTLVGQMSRVNDPGATFLRNALSRALPQP
jgi:hypothetical protein